ncbi:MAG: hypothetical protein COB24_10090 [Hyphomicrobiales bacterium]|nr:MAG: hypothetical protein COB24_10090 [Hyphomicrobiales bacterium]
MSDKTEYGNLADILAGKSDEHQQICNQLKTMILGIASDAQETVWVKQKIASYGVGPKKLTEHYVYIAPFKNHINLGFYRGALLDDSTGLLEGAGKQMRHMKLRHIDELDNAVIADLIVQAIKERTQALAIK